MNDILQVINNKSIHVLFADYTIILFSHPIFKSFEGNMNAAFETLDNSLKEIYFQVEKETQRTNSVKKNTISVYMQIGYSNKIIPFVTYIKF